MWLAQVMKRDAPFGGIQLVLSGDYFQLPPITKKWTPAMGNDAFLNRGYTFQCPAWRRCALQEVLLRKVSIWRRRWYIVNLYEHSHWSLHISADFMQMCYAAVGVAAGRPALCVDAEPGEHIKTILKALDHAAQLTACWVIIGHLWQGVRLCAVRFGRCGMGRGTKQ